MHHTWKNIKKSYKNSNFKVSAPTWNKVFELPYGSYSITDIQSCFKLSLKHGEKTVNSLIKIYMNKISSRLKLKQDIISNF